ncbi:unnamed protein product, partial [Cladocopium goreaui]
TDLPSKRGFPYVSFVNWLRYLVEYDQLEHLVGVKDLGEMNKILLTFWDKFSKIHTEHVISTKDTAFRKMCIPVLLHGDEGRGLKKKQLMVLATHGILGKGCSHSTNDVGGEALRLNMVGNTWLNHFLQCVLPISLYNETPEAFFHMLDLQAKEYKQLFEEGLVVQGRRCYVCCVGVKGDAPFISKSGKFERAFTRRPTRASSKKAADGICHLCLAGKENYDFPVPFEEYGVQRPAWLWTVGSVCPYSEPSPLLQIPFEIGGTTEALWCFDLFHNFHSGLGKYFASSAVCICLELVQLSIDDAFNFITADFNSYCRRNKESPYHKRLTKALFGVEQGFQAEAAVAINECLGGLYREGVFIPAARAERIARQGLQFLRCYAWLARESYERQMKRFPFAPKGHYLHHTFLELLHQSKRCDHCMNALCFSVQMQEDYIGRPSRLARRVSSRTTSLRVIQRTFLAVRNSLGAEIAQGW